MTPRGRPATYTQRQVAGWRRRLTNGATLREVADATGVDEKTIRRHVGPLRRRTGPRLQPLTVDDAVLEYKATGSYKTAAANLGVTQGVMRDRLWRAGILTDPTGRGRSAPTE